MENLTQRIAQIHDDHENGSRWLVRQTINLLYDLAVEPTSSPDEQLQKMREAGRELAHTRPAMAALAGAVGRILSTPGGLADMAHAARQLLETNEQAIAHITAFARPYLRGTILTHSLSGTVLDVLGACIPPVSEVIILEGRPLYEGRTTAESLKLQPVHLTLITDAQADIFLPGCQAVIVGADSLLADGSILNKAGTALLARAAWGHNVPFYVLSETLKISPRAWSGDLAWLEEQSPSEVWPEPVPGVAVRNFYFDHTPANLITSIITEEGLLDSAAIEQYAARLQQVPELS